MKLNTKILVLCLPVVLLPLSAIASDENRNNPFIKPSKRVDTQAETCDISVIQELVNRRVSELMPAPDVENTEVASTKIRKNMTNKEKIVASGAKFISHVNGTDVYFDETNGIFMYDREIISKIEG